MRPFLQKKRCKRGAFHFFHLFPLNKTGGCSTDGKKNLWLFLPTCFHFALSLPKTGEKCHADNATAPTRASQQTEMSAMTKVEMGVGIRLSRHFMGW